MDSRFHHKLKQDKELWDLFTRKEEYSPLFLDKHRRFPYYLSNNRSILEPIVSTFLVENGFVVEYPEDKRFAVCLTHDVDVVYFSKVDIGFYATRSLLRRKIKSALKTYPKMIGKWKLLWNFKDIMELEEKYDAKSSFYFLALHQEDSDFNYEIEDLENELGNIADNGWEVGLHGGHNAPYSLDEIKEEKQRLERVLGKKLIGYRSHFLRFRIPTTWELLGRAGFKYDTTFGYVGMLGFRNGMCHPFKPFSLNTDKEIEILEIPLNIQDVTLGERYMKLDANVALEVIKHVIDTVEKLGGVVTIVWHNNRLLNEDFGTLDFDEDFNRRFYEHILKYSYEKNAWITSGEEIWKLWDKMNHE